MYLHKKLLMVSVGIVGILCSCVTYIPLSIQKPAQLDIPPFKKIAILDFDFTGSWEFWYDKIKAGSMDELAKQIFLKKINHLQGENLDRRRTFPGKEVSTRLIASLVQNGHYQVLERDAIEKILAEHTLSMSGIVDETQAADIGKMLGADAILLGTGKYSVVDGGEWVERNVTVKREFQADSASPVTVVTDTVLKKIYCAQRKVFTELNFRIVDVAKGTIVAAKNNSTVSSLKNENEVMEDAYDGLSDWRETLSTDVQELVNQTVRQIAPYYVNETRMIKNGKSPKMKSGFKYAERGLIDDARAVWDEVTRDNSPIAAKDHVAAYYNLAVCAEVNGDFDTAESLFDRCYQISGKALYLDYKKNIQIRKQNAERLRKQNAIP